MQVSPLMWECKRLPRVLPSEGARLRFRRRRQTTLASTARWRSFWELALVSQWSEIAVYCAAQVSKCCWVLVGRRGVYTIFVVCDPCLLGSPMRIGTIVVA